MNAGKEAHTLHRRLASGRELRVEKRRATCRGEQVAVRGFVDLGLAGERHGASARSSSSFQWGNPSAASSLPALPGG